MKAGLIFAVLFAVLLASNSFSIGISPAKVELDYKPGQDYEFQFIVMNKNPFSTNAMINIIGVDGEKTAEEDKLLISKHIKFSPSYFTLAAGFGQPVKITIENFPKLEIPGQRRLWVSALEDKGGARTEVRGTILWRVPYPGFYFDFWLNEPKGEVNDTLDFEVNGFSRGYETVKTLKAKIRLYEKNKKFAEFYTNELRNVLTNQEFKLNYSWDSSGRIEGTYNWTAALIYDNKEYETKYGVFRIGAQRVDVVDFTKKVLIGKLNRFNVTIKGFWNDQISNVFAEVRVWDKESVKVIYSFKTDFIPSLKPWTIDYLFGYFDATAFELGSYPANVTVYYLDRQSTLNGNIQVLPEIRTPGMAFTNLTLIFMMMLLMMVLNGIIFIVLLKKSREREKPVERQVAVKEKPKIRKEFKIFRPKDTTKRKDKDDIGRIRF